MTIFLALFHLYRRFFRYGSYVLLILVLHQNFDGNILILEHIYRFTFILEPKNYLFHFFTYIHFIFYI